MKSWRINLILAFILLFGAVIIYRLFYIQVINHNYYLALAKGQQKLLEEIKGQRGEVFFQNKTQALAINRQEALVFICPKEIKQQEQTADKLARTLGLDKDFILENYENAIENVSPSGYRRYFFPGVFFLENR